MSPKIQNFPWIPDQHSQLGGVGQLSHEQLEQVINALTARVVTLEDQLQQTRNAQTQRFYIESMPAGVTDIDLSAQNVRYAPGTNGVMFYANTVKQVPGESYLEIDSNTLRLTDPTEGGETFEIYIIPFPANYTVIP
jgi:hypothetical protein